MPSESSSRLDTFLMRAERLERGSELANRTSAEGSACFSLIDCLRKRDGEGECLRLTELRRTTSGDEQSLLRGALPAILAALCSISRRIVPGRVCSAAASRSKPVLQAVSYRCS